MSSPGLWVLGYQRTSRRLTLLKEERGWTFYTAFLRVILEPWFWVITLLTKSEMEETTDIRPDVFLSNKGYLIIGAVRIGSGTVVHERVTIGARPITRGKPTIGERVLVGADCVIFGDIHVGDGATLLPRSVLSKSVPANAVVGGNPARVLRTDFDNATLRSRSVWNGELDGQSAGSTA